MQKIILSIILALIGTAQAAIVQPTILVHDVNTNQTVLSDNADVVRPMASITKLMTAMIVLDHFKLEDKVPTGKKSTATVENLLTRLLVRSDNYASELLARAHRNGRSGFLEAMNAKVQFLGLTNTQFNDPSGLIETNTTTARDLVKLVTAASNYEFISTVSRKPEVQETTQVKQKTRTVTIQNTNRNILYDFNNILISKTGFTSKAGRCLAMLVDKGGHKYAIIILGEPSKQSRETVARNLLNINTIQ